MFVPGAWGQADVQGQWSTLPYTMPINPVHVALLNNGKVLIVSGSGECSGTPLKRRRSGILKLDTITTQSLAWDMFCNGMLALADGRFSSTAAPCNTTPSSGSPKSCDLRSGHQYFYRRAKYGPWPLVSDNDRVERWPGHDILRTQRNWRPPTPQWRFTPSDRDGVQQYTASWTPPLYPRMHLLPNGNIFYSGRLTTSRMFNRPPRRGHVANTKFGSYADLRLLSAVPLTPANNYEPKVMILGGGIPTATATTEIIDLGAGTPAWQFGPDMRQARVEMDAVLLPTGKVLAMGGSSNDEDATIGEPECRHLRSCDARTTFYLGRGECLLLVCITR